MIVCSSTTIFGGHFFQYPPQFDQRSALAITSSFINIAQAM
jgi:hypothetical protein